MNTEYLIKRHDSTHVYAELLCEIGTAAPDADNVHTRYIFNLYGTLIECKKDKGDEDYIETGYIHITQIKFNEP